MYLICLYSEDIKDKIDCYFDDIKDAIIYCKLKSVFDEKLLIGKLFNNGEYNYIKIININRGIIEFKDMYGFLIKKLKDNIFSVENNNRDGDISEFHKITFYIKSNIDFKYYRYFDVEVITCKDNKHCSWSNNIVNIMKYVPKTNFKKLTFTFYEKSPLITWKNF